MASLPTGSNYLTYAGSLGIYYYYYVNPGNGDAFETQIYSYDEMPDGAVLLLNIPNGAVALNLLSGSSGDALFTVSLPDGFEIYGTDGTVAGTNLLLTVPLQGSIAGFAQPGAGLDLFTVTTANPPQSGYSTTTSTLYGSDGTPAGTNALATVTVGDLLGSSGGGIGYLGQSGNETLYTVTTLAQEPAGSEYGSDAYFQQYTATVYSTDGTVSGTQALATVTYGTFYNPGGGVSLLASEGNGKVFFTTTTADFTSGANNTAYEQYTTNVYGTDGTAAGTDLLTTVTYGTLYNTGGGVNYVAQTANGDVLFTTTTADFVTGPDNTSYEHYTTKLFSTDGTTSGTQMLVDVTYGFSGNSAGGINLVTDQGGLIFFAAEASTGAEVQDNTLYVSDGTAAGTHELFDAGAGTITYVTTAAGQSYFSVTGTSGTELYVTNLTNTSASLLASGAAGDTFSVAYNGTKTLVEVLAAGAVSQRYWVNPNDGSVAVAGDEYVWAGPTAGDWNVASNWDDVTAGETPATIAPGANDSVTFNSSESLFQVIGGTGDAAYLTFNGDNVVTGTLSAGVLNVNGNYSILDINSGAAVTASNIFIGTGGDFDSLNLDGGSLQAGTVSIGGDDSELSVSGGSLQAASIVLAVGDGGVEVSDGAAVQANSFSIALGEITVDGTSSIEAGTLGNAALGALTVDPGETVMVGLGQISGLVNNGSITVSGSLGITGYPTDGLFGSGTITLLNGALAYATGATVSGSLDFRLHGDASLDVAAVAAGAIINFTGPGDVLNIVGYQDGPYNETTFAMNAAINGFNVADAITVEAPVTNASYLASSTAGTGSLVLTDGATTVTTLALNGNYAGDEFLAIQIAANESELVLAPGAASGVSAGTDTADDYVWAGPVSGNWNAAANWDDVTAGENPARIAPGANDSVTFNSSESLFQVIGGIGDAASLTFDGDNVVIGSLTAGVLNIASNNSILDIDSGAAVTASSIFVGAGGAVYDTLNLDGGSLQAGSIVLVADYDEISVSDGGAVHTDSLTIAESDITVDGTSSLEVGTLGNAAVGALTVDPGETLQISLVGISANLVDNGNIIVSVDISLGELAYESAYGSGTITLLNGAVAYATGATFSGSLDFQLNGNASLDVAEVGAGDTINLSGPGNVLNIQSYSVSTYENGYYSQYDTISMSAAINGFNSTDAITVEAPITNAAYVAGPTAGTGSLVLTDGTTAVTTLALNGNYAGDEFLAIQLPTDDSEIVIAPGAASGVSAGTGTADAYVWAGPVSGNWNAASNWDDVTAGENPATIAPGANDSVTFNSSDSLFQVIGGTGHAAYLTFNGDNVVTGTLSAGLLNIGGTQSTLDIDSGATVTASSLYIGPGGGDRDALNLNGGSLQASTLSISGYYDDLAVSGGSLQAASIALVVYGGGVSVTDGGAAQTDSLSVDEGHIIIDGTSSLEVGTLSNAALGALTVDPGETVQIGQGEISANLVDNGNIIVSNNVGLIGYTSDSVSCSGTITLLNGALASAYGETVAGSLDFQLDGDASLDVSDVGASDTINLTGPGNVLNIQGYGNGFSDLTTYSVNAAITGFNNVDQIVIDNLTGATATYVTGTGLVLTSGTTMVTLDIQGSLTTDDFIITPAGSNTLIDLTLSTIVTGGSSVYVPPGTTVSSAVIYSGGYEEVESGGTDDSPTLSGGTLELVFGAAVGGNISFTGTGGDLIIDPSSGGTTTIPANTLTGFTAGDTIELSGVPYDAANDSYTVATAGTVTIDADGSFYNIIIAGVTVGQDNFVLSGDLAFTEAACYVAGTRIATAVGEVEVEDLEIGDFVETLHAGLKKIKWIGWRSYDGRFIADNKDILPIRIAQGAIAENLPSRDLFVSPGHAICIDGALIHAFRLVNGVSVTQAASVESVVYYHIETEYHEVIFAENCPAETFINENFRAQFQNAAEYRALYRGQSAASIACLPRLEDGFLLHAIQQRLNARAGLLPVPEAPGPLRGYVDELGPTICSGWAQDLENPETPVCLDILVDGARVARVLANMYRADLRQAGLGSGCHAFRAPLPTGCVGQLEVRRASDGAELPWTESALTLAA